MESLEIFLEVQSSGLYFSSRSFNVYPMGNDGKMGPLFCYLATK